MLIRIYFSDDKQIDWNVPAPEAINFGDVLDAICHASNDQLIVSSFEFTDEEEDRITVKNEDDLQSMIQYCQGQGSERIVIYPKLCRKPGKRNKFGLKVAIAQPKTALPQNVSQIGADNPRTDQHNPVTLSNSSQMQPNSTDMQFSQLPGLSNVSFTYLETLGNGNSGIVYKVVHNASRIEMAIKSIAIDLTGQEQDRIKSELKILNECNNSQQMIDFYGAFLHENRVFLCMEFMDGGSLDRYGKIPELVLRRVTHRVVSGLKFLWSKRIMHRDVKPSNMLVNTKGQVKLCDFGVSRQLVNSIAQTYIGTNAYMAPERVRGADYTIHSDIWSLGLSICEMATGMYPYPELDSKIKGSRGVIPMEVLQCIVNAAPPQLPSHEFSPAIVDFVSGCLQKDAKFRPSPDILSQHVFLQINDILDHEDSVIAQWVAERIVLAVAKK